MSPETARTPNKQKDLHVADDPGASLPQIVVSSRQLRNITTDALNALVTANDPPFIFVRSGEICHVIRDESERPAIVSATDSWIRGAMSRSANFMRMDGHGKLKGTFPPPEVVRDLASIDRLPFPPLASVTEVPTLRADGSILNKPGYDAESCVFYAPSSSLTHFPLPPDPDTEKLREAVALVYEAIGDFPYADEASRANALGLLLTPVMRPAIFGCTPLAVVDAPQAGTGKSLLIDVLSIITTGRPSAMVPYPRGEEEMQKQITASLMCGRQLIAFDNLEGELKSPALALALTAKEYEARILGVSKNMTAANMSTWVVTGNNIKPAGDMPRRCYQIRLDAKQSKPYGDGRKFKHPNLLEWVRDVRAELLHALLIIARAWYAEKCPQSARSVVGSFEDWHRKIAGIVAHAGVPGFLANYTKFIDEEDDSQWEWEVFLLEIFGMLRASKVNEDGTEQTNEFTVKELMGHFNSDWLRDVVPNEITECLARKGNHPVAIGKMIGARRQRRFGGAGEELWLERQEPGIETGKPKSAHKGVAKWRVMRAEK